MSLPTGLGKTLIAFTVMLNYYRWFSDGQIFFLAPTKPLVSQQMNAFLDIITEVPEEEVFEITGIDKVDDREEYYKNGRVFFMTPQTLENDIDDKLVDCKKIVLLVVDEAHRALKDYAYCNVVKQLVEQEVGFRILGLSATPVSKISNL